MKSEVWSLAGGAGKREAKLRLGEILLTILLTL
jgi:hypothetical protein